MVCLCSRLHLEDALDMLPQHVLPPEVRLCGKMEVLDRILLKLHTAGHKVRLGPCYEIQFGVKVDG